MKIFRGVMSFLWIVLIFFNSTFSKAQFLESNTPHGALVPIEKSSHSFFRSGEELDYVVRYGFIKGGEATIRVLSTRQNFEGKSTIHFQATGKTSGAFDIFYKVRNQYDSYIDPETFLPYAYSENIKENSYTRVGTTVFDYSKKVAQNKNGHFSIQTWTRDILSSYFFARSIDLTQLKIGDKLDFSYFLEDSIYPMRIVYLGKEKVNSPTGTYNCLKFSPSVEPGRVFKSDSKLFFWITDDENHIPIKAKADILIGSVVLELKAFKNLMKPMVPMGDPN